MTVATQFHTWQQNPMQPDPGTCSPFLVNLRDWLIRNWGGQNLGCYASRPVVGGSSPSSHGSGAALDWRYQDPGIGRQRMLDEVLPTLINMSMELAVNAVHDYVGCRIWRPPGTSGRPAQPSPDSGWRQQTPGSQMGQSWALWLHIEVLNTRWSDTTPIDELLAGTTPPPQPPPSGGSPPGWNPGEPQTAEAWVAYGAAQPTPPGNPQLARGQFHSNVTWLQAVLASMQTPPNDPPPRSIYNPAWITFDQVSGGGARRDLFGDATFNAVVYWQSRNGLTADGRFGPQTSDLMRQRRGR